jgi:hypothetical protein
MSFEGRLIAGVRFKTERKYFSEELNIFRRHKHGVSC